MEQSVQIWTDQNRDIEVKCANLIIDRYIATEKETARLYQHSTLKGTPEGGLSRNNRQEQRLSKANKAIILNDLLVMIEHVPSSCTVLDSREFS